MRNSLLELAVRVAGDNDLAEIARLRSLWTGVEDAAAFRERGLGSTNEPDSWFRTSQPAAIACSQRRPGRRVP